MMLVKLFFSVNKEFNNNDLNIINVGQDIDNLKIIDITHIVKNVPDQNIINQDQLIKKVMN